jgi:DNA sulfur modification protein DndB
VANQTTIPALRARVGDWDYYICSMKYGVVDSQIKFAYELGGNKDLNTMIQRGLGVRAQEITDYLMRSEHRFLGAMIVACWGGAPKYLEVRMDDPDGILANLDDGFGVLTFDGSQRFFALDGQHRLRAIRDALNLDPQLAQEEICVLIVSHFDTEEGREPTRRLFTNINRNAKATSAAENIALDEDDGYAILTRRFLTDHDWLKMPGVVKVFTKTNDVTGEVVMAGDSISKADPKSFTTITVLYKILQDLGRDLDAKLDLKVRPNDEELESAFATLTKRLDDLFDACGEVKTQLEAAASARDIRAPKGREPEGHPMMRPVVQRAVARLAEQVLGQGALTWDELTGRLKTLDWELQKAPWLAVYSPEQGRMLTGGTFNDLLDQLLLAHVAPPTAQYIKDARKSFKDIVGRNYPVSEQDLRANLKEVPAASE